MLYSTPPEICPTEFFVTTNISTDAVLAMRVIVLKIVAAVLATATFWEGLEAVGIKCLWWPQERLF